MPVPGYPLDTHKVNGLNQVDDHPGHHNTLAAALNSVSETLDAGVVPSTIVDAPGDLIIGTAPDVVAKLTRGASGTVLYSDDSTVTAPHGLRWGVVERYAPWDFPVGRYGAKGDDATDDSAAFKACMADAVAYARANNWVASIILDDKTYLLNTLDQRPTNSGGGIAGSTGAFNTLWAMPDQDPTTGRKLNLKIRGSLGTSGQALHWLQTEPAKTGSVIRTSLQPSGPTTVNGLSIFPSVIGSPHYSGGNNWSNTLIDIGGVTVMMPNQGNIVAYDFARTAQLYVIGGLTATTTGTVGGQGGQPNISTPNHNGGAIGMYTPANQNNDLCMIDSYCCEGYQTGLIPGEHCIIQRAALLYLQDGIYYSGGGNYQHGWTINSLSIEVCDRYGINCPDATDLSCPINIGAWHSETLAGGDIYDPGSHLKGQINWHAVAKAAPVVTGAKNLRIYNEKLERGPVTGPLGGEAGSAVIPLPAVPTSGTALANPYGNPAQVFINGGTVSAVAVNGVQVAAASPCSVVVPATHTIAVTYSAAPTWLWSIL
jgi:hypothetical protein